MDLNIDFSALWRQVRRISEKREDFDWSAGVVLDPVDIALKGGKEVSLDQIEYVGGLLSFEGRQVLLFIPDQFIPVDIVQSSPERGKRFHVSHCKTLQDMREKGRFQRYFATNKLDGYFLINGNDSEGTYQEVQSELRVCKNCLEAVNYQDYAHRTSGERSGIWSKFEIAEFFNTFSTSFRYLPRDIAARPGAGKYTDDWTQISASVRQRCGFKCDGCGLNLSQHRRLLHVHHINGVKSDNASGNLRPLCADCHRKQPFHERMFVSAHDMATLSRLRNEQGLVGSSWDAVIKLADLSVRGALLHAQHRGFKPPSLGHRATDANGNLVEMSAAWAANKVGICLLDKPTVPGWEILSGVEFMRRY